jgi:hypothetical protein
LEFFTIDIFHEIYVHNKKIETDFQEKPIRIRCCTIVCGWPNMNCETKIIAF